MKKLDLINSMIFSRPEEMKYWLAYWRFLQKKIVFTNGCFDIIHRGHVEYLSQAADYGDILIIGLNSDSSVNKIKGKNRPIQDEQSRAEVLAAMQFIDYIVIFDQETPKQLIEYLQPNVLIKGSDYKISDIVGGDFVIANGGKVITIDFIEGYSTTKIIDKILK